MTNFKILIVEDEILIAEDLSDVLRSFGISEIDMAHDKPSALNKIEEFNPDLILLDVRMENELTGIEIAQILNEKYKTPFIFITAHSDVEMMKNILKTGPVGYITKPVKKADLFANVVLMNERLKAKSTKQIMLKDGIKNVVLDLNDILYIESDGNYIEIHSINKKFALRQNMESITAQLDDSQFFRVHRSYIVNLKKITSYTRKDLMIASVVVPISKNVIESFEKVMGNQI
jgi:two-component system response regulator LytT